jgi:hypothetical protein
MSRKTIHFSLLMRTTTDASLAARQKARLNRFPARYKATN